MKINDKFRHQITDLDKLIVPQKRKNWRERESEARTNWRSPWQSQ